MPPSERVPAARPVVNAPCPLLPEADGLISAAWLAALGKDRGPVFYEMSLRYAQTLWQQGLPAQALLQINKALACPIHRREPVLERLPLPYHALCWILRERPQDQFLGNPVRHFQHLATRMVPPHRDLRTWRAWACWYLARRQLPPAEYPGDSAQIRKQGLVEPIYQTIANELERHSPANDLESWREAGALRPITESVGLEVIEPVSLPIVRDLAHRIWPQAYANIISPAQIDYMMLHRYNLPVMERQMREERMTYALIHVWGAPAGYLAAEPREHSSELFLHKLYLLPEAHGRGVGATTLHWLTQFARDRGLAHIRLRVNRQNAPAIRAYLRAGFTFEQDLVTDIGDGFVMDDHMMVKSA
jgi:GNAT superfamily N-acetyltransferase